MIYHNITPHAFFLDYHRILTRECYKGRLEIRRFVDRVDLALGDSEFNRRELEDLGFKKTGVLPLLIDWSKFDRMEDPVVRRMYPGDRFTLLFVGRVIPNKKFEDLIRTFAVFRKTFHSASRLILVGDYRGMERYMAALHGMVEELDLPEVHFPGRVDFTELLAYFRMADVYLSMSEHEGFGVPIVEAFRMGIPVVAYAAGAVEETMNGGGLLLRRKDFLRAAALLDRLREDEAFRGRVLASQKEAFGKYTRENVIRILMGHLEDVVAR